MAAEVVKEQEKDKEEEELEGKEDDDMNWTLCTPDLSRTSEEGDIGKPVMVGQVLAGVDHNGQDEKEEEEEEEGDREAEKGTNHTADGSVSSEQLELSFTMAIRDIHAHSSPFPRLNLDTSTTSSSCQGHSPLTGHNTFLSNRKQITSSRRQDH